MKIEDLPDAINQALLFTLSNLHTMTVCKVTAVQEKTISCQPVVARVVNGEAKTLPEFIKVPPVFMGGGTSYTAHPISIGDYCLLFISERCLDNWYEGSDFVAPIEMRMHDYSDGIALVGLKNKAGLIDIPDIITQFGDLYHDGDIEVSGELSAEKVIPANGFTGTKVADGVSFTFENGILTS